MLRPQHTSGVHCYSRRRIFSDQDRILAQKSLFWWSHYVLFTAFQLCLWICPMVNFKHLLHVFTTDRLLSHLFLFKNMYRLWAPFNCYFWTCVVQLVHYFGVFVWCDSNYFGIIHKTFLGLFSLSLCRCWRQPWTVFFCFFIFRFSLTDLLSWRSPRFNQKTYLLPQQPNYLPFFFFSSE